MTLASLSRGNDIRDEMVNLQTIINKTSMSVLQVCCRRIKTMNIKCKSCGSDLEYDFNQIFTHWDYPYVLCPKCCAVVLVPSDIKEILKGEVPVL